VSLPAALAAYRVMSRVARPLAGPLLNLRVRQGKEDPGRVGERFGHASAPRPPGKLIWLHGASVGEAKVLLQVREGVQARLPSVQFLLTTGTRTSADLVARSSPPALHQFAPIDAIGPVRRFLAHWRPHLAVFAESELWPNLIEETARAGVRLALVNARMTEKSLANWARTPQSAAHLLARFDVILCADRATSQGLETLSGSSAPCVGNLKLAAPAPVADPALTAALRAAIGDRPVWLAASTHAGEEEIILAAHAEVRAKSPDALLILAPRHPDRGEAIHQLAGGPPRRSRGQTPRDEHPVYLFDTMGELGAAYAVAPVTFVAGSLLPALKGHNPIEPAKAGSAVLSGPYVTSFADIYTAFDQAGAVQFTASALDLARAVHALCEDEEARQRAIHASAEALAGAQAGLQRTIDALCALLPTGGTHAAA
jgi:3-deoxy-D-manno-octulosonic-acid transferase